MKSRLCLLAALAGLAFGLLVERVFAFDEPAHASLPNLDKRLQGGAGAKAKAAAPAPAAAARAFAVDRLRGKVAGLRTDWDEVLDTPKLIRATDGFLSGPNGEGKGISREQARRFDPGDPHRSIKAFLNEHAALFGHDAQALNGARLKRDHVAPHNGLRTVVWEQQLDGIDVFEGVLLGHVTRQGELVNLSCQFVPDPARAANAGHPNRAALLNAPGVPARQAIVNAAKSVGEDTLGLGEVTATDPTPKGAEKLQRFKAGPLPGLAQTRLVWLPMDPNTLRLCWEVELTRRAGGETYRALIDAQTGEVMVRRCLTVYLAAASYRVFTGDSPGPLSPALPTPLTNQAPFVPPELVTLAALDPLASPVGWIHDEENETRGNNVEAHLDHDGDNVPDLPRPQGAPFRVFDYPLDLKQSPTLSSEAAVVSLFYWCNWMHDRLYALGFTEGAGNFQKDNFDRGGLGNDAMVADAQDGSGVNNANFTPAREGTSGRIQMYIFDGPEPDRDGDFDAEIILHEYTHGLTDRLVGGGVGIGLLQTAGLAEGWSDFYALALLSQPEDDPGGTYPVGGFTTFQYRGLRQNYYFGIRRYPYSTDLTKSPLTFRDIDPELADPHLGVPLSPIQSPFNPNRAADVHKQGEVWCVTLWDARANLIAKYGYEYGNTLALQLVTDGLKLSPPNCTFLQARDAILQADLVNFGGVNQKELWSAFGKRGLGTGASGPPSSTTTGVRESYAVPETLEVFPVSGLIFSGPPGGPLTPGCRSFTLTNSTDEPLQWSAHRTAVWLTLDPTNGVLEPSRAVEIVACLNDQARALNLGTHFESVVFSNTVSGGVQRRTAQVRVMEFAAMPFVETFESGALAPHWQVTGTDSRRVAVTTSEEANTGSYHLTMASSGNGVPARNEVTLGLDLEGYTNVVLRFWVKTLGDEPDGPPAAPFVDSANFDGVAISADGFRWYEAQGLRTLNASYSDVVVNLDETVARHGLAYHSAFRIRFNQYDNDPVPEDGIAIDDIAVTGLAPRRLSVSLPGEASEGDGTLTARGSVTLPVPLTADLAVGLVLSEPGEILVPSIVLLRAGETNTAFDVTLVDDAVLDGSRRVRLTATAPGFISGVAGLTVHDDESATLFLVVPPLLREGDGFLSGQGLVLLDTLPSTDVEVALTSSDASELRVPPSVVLLAGQDFAAFSLEVVDDSEIDGPRDVTVTARVAGWVEGAEPTRVLDNEQTRLALTLPNLITESAVSFPYAGLVRLSGTVGTNVAVTFSSTPPDRVSLPAVVTVAAQQFTTGFTFAPVDNDALLGSDSITITASAPGFASASVTLRLVDDETAPLTFQPSPAHQSTDTPVNTDLGWSAGLEELIVNGDFEAGNLAGWFLDTSGEGEFVINDGHLDPPGPEEPAAPWAGRFSALCQQTGPGQRALFQDVSLPLFADALTLTWSQRISNHAADFSDNQRFRVEVRGLDNRLITEAFETKPGDPLVTGWTEHSLSLLSFRGQSIRIAFVEEDDLGYLNAHIDNVRIMLSVPGVAAYDVYFGTNSALSETDYLGSTTNTTWDLPGLEVERDYYWQVVANKADGQRPGPLWRFRTRGLGGLHHFAWSPIPSPQSLSAPFLVTLTARDDLGNVVSNFTGRAFLSALHQSTMDAVGMLAYDAHVNPLQEYRKTFGAINSFFTNYTLATTAVTDPNSLRAQLGGKQVFLVPEQLFAPAGTLAGLGASWAGVLQDFVQGGGNVIVCSHAKDEHLLLVNSELLHLVKIGDDRAAQVNAPAPHPLTEGVGLPFTAVNIARYSTSNGVVALRSLPEGDAIVVARNQGAGRVVMIGTDYSTNRTGMDRVIANAVQQAQTPATPPFSVVPSVSAYFVKGVWSGMVSVPQNGPSLRLQAMDEQGHSGLSAAFAVTAPQDLSVAIVDAPDPISVGGEMISSITVSNAGPGAVPSVVLNNTLPAQATLLDLTASQGACTVSNLTVRCELGAMAGGGRTVVTLRLRADAGGTLRQNATVVGPPNERYTANNGASASTRVTLPLLAIAPATVTEGDTGVQELAFAVTLTPASSQTVSCDFASSNAVAKAGQDYVATSGRLTFPPGVTHQTIRAQVIGDTLDELPEGFYITLFNPVNAVIDTGLALGFIHDDDPAPSLTISDAMVAEGPTGKPTNAVFALTLSAPSGRAVSVNYSTESGSATPVLDYSAGSGSVTFAPGTTEQAMAVTVHGDQLAESNETFFVLLNNPLEATLVTNRAVGVILDDDVGQVDRFAWSLVPSPQLLGAPFQVQVTALDGLSNVVSDFNGTVNLTALAAQREVAIGGGGSLWEFPLGAYYHDSRLQSIYLAQEIGEPGRVTGLALRLERTPGQTLKRWTLRLKHTRLSAFRPAAWEQEGWTMVYQNDETLTVGGWVTFRFQTPFEFNGSENVMLDWSFNNASFTSDGLCYFSPRSEPRSVRFRTDSAFADPLNWSGTQAPPPIAADRVPDVRFLIESPISVSPAKVTGFVDGVWSGQAMVEDAGLDVALRATDNQGHTGVGESFEVHANNDLALLMTDAPDPVGIGSPLSFFLTVTNTGPLASLDVILTNPLPPGVVFSAAEPSQGSCRLAGGAVSCELGSLAGGAAASVRLEVIPKASGILTNRAVVRSSSAEAYTRNNQAQTITRVNPESLFIEDVTVTETDTGTVTADFAVRLSGFTTNTVTVEYVTRGGTATNLNDFDDAAGVLTFPPGATNQTVSISVHGDSIHETNETLYVSLFNPVNAVLGRAEATGTILDDDAPPTASILDASGWEGNAGPTNLIFAVQLSQPSGFNVSVTFSTSNGTASAGADFSSRASLPVLFPRGLTNRIINVPLVGDRGVEPDETFYVTIANPVGVTIGRPRATGTILNDDGLSGVVERFEWSPIPSAQRPNRPIPVVLRALDTFNNTVSNFSGTIALTGRVGGTDVAVGNGGGAASFPLGSSFHDSRTQVIYLSGEIGAARRVLGLALEVVLPPGQALQHFTIRLKHTLMNGFGLGASWENGGWTTVYQADETIRDSGWVTFPFTAPFEYNGANNLMIDFTFDNSHFTIDGVCRAFTTNQMRVLSARADSEFGDPLAWSGSSSPVPVPGVTAPNLRLLSGLPVAVHPIRSGRFVNGVWAAQVTVRQPAVGMALRAEDAIGHFGLSDLFSVELVPDGDGDGLTDAWEREYFGSTDAPNGGPQLDPDGDGLTNLDEFNAGTHPLDPASVLAILSVERRGPDVHLRFNTAAGRTYRVESSTDLAQGAWAPAANDLSGTGLPVEVIDQGGALGQTRFYRVRVLP